jgi:Immunity protein 53
MTQAGSAGRVSTVLATLDFLQDWYSAQCDGEREHEFGVEIGTLDNPGWRVAIALTGTPLSGVVLAREVVERTEHDWLQIWTDADIFHAACGPRNLHEALERFRDFATPHAA